jgi:hypothetical protein
MALLENLANIKAQKSYQCTQLLQRSGVEGIGMLSNSFLKPVLTLS